METVPFLIKPVTEGLLSLTVEFYRSKPSHCTQNAPLTSDFPYGEDNLCGLVCSIDEGPHSPLRGGSANNIYVIPTPDKFSFGTATLLAAACCIPAILSMISMWNKILEINYRTRHVQTKDANQDELIEGTNGATPRKMEGVNDRIRGMLKYVEIPVFSGAVLAILVIGERNLFSTQVRYQTEPIASIGRWPSPLVVL